LRDLAEVVAGRVVEAVDRHEAIMTASRSRRRPPMQGTLALAAGAEIPVGAVELRVY
jgi:hypothetical protein